MKPLHPRDYNLSLGKEHNLETAVKQNITLVAIAALLIGIYWRFTNLDGKVFWHDEAYTAAVISARPGRYTLEPLFNGQIHSTQQILSYQALSPDLTWRDMLVRKGTEDVQHPPLYYGLLRFWAEVNGTNPAVLRQFSAGLSLLVFPAVYWLCLELFQSHTIAKVAIALFALSPYHLALAQELRQFGFWTGLAILASAALLAAVRLKTWQSWLGYGLVMVAGFYTSLFSGAIALSHFVYILGIERQIFQGLKFPSLQLGRLSRQFLVTMAAVSILFLPWLGFLVAARTNLSNTTAWTSISLPPLVTLQVTIFNFSRSFADFNWQYTNPLAYAIALPILCLQGYAVYFLVAHAPRAWFLVSLGGGTALLLAVPDLVGGGPRFTVARYLIICFVVLHLSVAYWLGQRLKPLLASLIVLGALSCHSYSQAPTWWHKEINKNFNQVAEVINTSDRPLVITDAFGYNGFSAIALSYLLKPDVQMLLMPSVGKSMNVTALPEAAKTIFLLNLPPSFRTKFGDRFTLVFKDLWHELWQSTELLSKND